MGQTGFGVLRSGIQIERRQLNKLALVKECGYVDREWFDNMDKVIHVLYEAGKKTIPRAATASHSISLKRPPLNSLRL